MLRNKPLNITPNAKTGVRMLNGRGSWLIAAAIFGAMGVVPRSPFRIVRKQK